MWVCGVTKMRNFLVECDSGNGEKIVSSSGAGKTEYPHTKNEAGPLVYTI